MATDHVQELIFTLQQTGARQLNDRACAIVSAAFIEGCLGGLIVTKMQALNSKLRKRLFDGFGALSTASARMDVAYGLDILTKSWYDDLCLVAKIRNKFAHNVGINYFEDGDIPELVKKIKYRPGDGMDYGVHEASTRSYLHESWADSSNREKFDSTASYFVVTLSNLLRAEGANTLARTVPPLDGDTQ